MRDDTDGIPEVLAALKEGGQESLAAIFLSHRERLRRMIEFRLDARLRGRVSASDVMQEAYIDALKRLSFYQDDPAVPFFIWLRSVTVQRLVEVHRQHLGAKARNAAKEVSLKGFGGLEASSDMMAEFLDDLTSPSLAAERGETLARLRQTLDGLDPIDREVLALRHFEDMSNHEVAATLGIQSAAASKRYVRALERLKDALGQQPEFEESSP